MSIPVTQHFSVAEFACKDGQPYPVDRPEDGTGIPTGWKPPLTSPQTWFTTRLLPLCQTLEAIRQHAILNFDLSNDRAGLVVDSGYRDEAYDQRLYDAHVAAIGDDGLVAPASRSQHPRGCAADVRHAVLTPTQLFSLTLKLFSNNMLPYLGGIGLYPSFVHVDTRPRGLNGTHLALWGGTRPSNIA